MSTAAGIVHLPNSRFLRVLCCQMSLSWFGRSGRLSSISAIPELCDTEPWLTLPIVQLIR